MSYSAGVVTGNDHVGGLLGLNRGHVTDCYSLSEINGESQVGGLVGQNGHSFPVDVYSNFVPGYIRMCYAASVVSGVEEQSFVGGLVGYCELGRGTTCSDFISGFWDTETSGLTNMCGSDRGSPSDCDDSFGKTIAEMQTATTFLEAGWDFIGETENGTEDIWWILEGQDYPRLWWELIPEN
jgi:hypothetical protein